jgi:signal transduction histidine kinase
MPDEPLIIAMRLGMTVVVLIAAIIRRWWRYEGRHTVIVAGMMYYLIIVTGIITGLAKAHPSYFGGYSFVIIVLGALPVAPSWLFAGIVLSLTSFFALSIHAGVEFSSPLVQYGLQDLMSSVAVHGFLSIGWTILRRTGFKHGRALQEQRDLLERQTQELTALNEEKNEMMGILAHDLKNPIGALRGMGELIKGGYVEGQTLQEVAEQIVLTSDQMLNLVKNLLDENQLDTGKRLFMPIKVDVVEVLEPLLQRYRPMITAKRLTLHVLAEKGEHCVLADKQALSQIFDNLLSNAIKYSPHGKNIWIRIKKSHSSLADSRSSGNKNTNALMTNVSMTDDTLQIEVEDEGEGISDEDKRKLFGRFVRLSARPTGGEHSTGLGLSIVKKMVDAMNGSIRCESEPGKGATFIIELPSV